MYSINIKTTQLLEFFQNDHLMRIMIDIPFIHIWIYSNGTCFIKECKVLQKIVQKRN